MSVQILKGPPTYNKAPSPAKTPSAVKFPTVIPVGHDQFVWVSIPQPDKLHLSMKLAPTHFVKWYSVEHPHDYGRMIMQALATGHVGAVKHSKYVKHAHLYTSIQVLVGSAECPTFFKLSYTPKDVEGPHTLSIQMNPARMTEEGIFELLDRLHTATGKRLLVGAMLADAKVARLDIATDIIGLELTDLLIRKKKTGKRNYRCAADGKLETIELWSTSAKAMTTASRVVIAYDKGAEIIAHGENPPHAPAPLIRVEVSKRRFGNKSVFLADLPSIANPLSSLTVGRVRAGGMPVAALFPLYVELRRTRDASTARILLDLSVQQAEKFEHSIATSPGDVINGNTAWVNWSAGLLHTGAHLLVEAAVTKSGGVPLPVFEE